MYAKNSMGRKTGPWILLHLLECFETCHPVTADNSTLRIAYKFISNL